MAYIEKRIRNKREYYALIKKIRFWGKSYKIKHYIGATKSVHSANELLAIHNAAITEKEVRVRIAPIKGKKVTFHPNLLEKAEHAVVHQQNLLASSAARDAWIADFAKKFIFNSNNIEGSRIPAAEVEKILIGQKTKYHNLNEVREVRNSLAAITYLEGGFTFTLGGIKRLYHILTAELMMATGMPYPTGFKKIPNIVGNMPTTSPEHVEDALQKLLAKYKEYRTSSEKIAQHPLFFAFDWHLEFEAIHPFQDGNGRTGRMLMNKMLMQFGYLPMIIFRENTQRYFNALENARSGFSNKKYYQFMLEQVIKTVCSVGKGIAS